MLNINLINIILTILAENGETRTLTLVKLINSYTKHIKTAEPLIFEHITRKNKISVFIAGVVIDWGDSNITDDMVHNYNIIGKKYRVKIYNNPDKKICIHNINTWPDTLTDFISIGRIGITELNYMFYHNQFNGRIHPNWDTSKIVNMNHMFYFADNFNRKIGDNWGTSKVTNMRSMFYYAKKFNQKLGDNWDTSLVTDMSYMFSLAENFNQKIGDNWNTSRVTNMKDMFPENLSKEYLPVWYNCK